MSKKIYYLDQYPFDETAEKCKNYIHSFDWREISDDIKEKKVIYFDVSDCIGIFEHLQLDDNYQLLCYVSREYHGMLGETAALEKGQNIKAKYKGLGIGFNVKLPQTAADPMEVVYHDGTPEGYLEAVLFSEFMYLIPNSHFQHHRKAPVITSLPKDTLDMWDIFVDVSDVRPKIFIEGDNASLYIFRRKHAGIFAPTDSRDEIILSQYNFDKYGFTCHFNNYKKISFKEHPSNSLRKNYCDTKRCCLFADVEMKIAKQKKIRHKIIVNAIKCTHCGDIIESTPEDPEVTCICGICTVDGEHDYLGRTAYEDGDFIDLSIQEEIIE